MSLHKSYLLFLKYSAYSLNQFHSTLAPMFYHILILKVTNIDHVLIIYLHLKVNDQTITIKVIFLLLNLYLYLLNYLKYILNYLKPNNKQFLIIK
jgi:hypothetical protein